MPFTVEEFRDLARILKERPEWREELRRLVLTDEFLSLPEQIARLQRETEQRFQELNRTTEDWHTPVGAILVIAHREVAHSRANTRFAPTQGIEAVFQCHVV